MLGDIEQVLLSETEIRKRVKQLGEEISKDYADKNLLLVGILKGSVVFMSDLMRSITLPDSIDFMSVSSYGARVKTTGVVKIIRDLDNPLADCDVLIVEDILDSGLTLHYIIDLLKSRTPKSIKICTLLDKPAFRKAEITADYCGFVIPDKFVVGYGLDYDEKYRNLPFIGVLRTGIFSK
jgi:hypoxanthine phosphoribosyltransferase